MNRFQWMLDEVRTVQRRKFFVFKAADADQLHKFEEQYGPLPEDYREFAREFGEASLFREFIHGSSYWLYVFCPPKLINEMRGTKFFRFGFVPDCGDAVCRWKAGQFEDHGAVFFDCPSNRKRAGSFQDWFFRSFQVARKKYSERQWATLLEPVQPFTERERQIVGAMELFEVRKVGMSETDKILFEVTNRSEVELSWLRFTIRWPGSWGVGALPVSGIKPGETRIVESTFYEDIADQREISLVKRPPPEPEDRPYCSYLFDPSPQPLAGDDDGDSSEQKDDRDSSDPAYGPWKFIHEIDQQDMLAHPVWLWCMQLGLPNEEEGPIGGDETSMRPLLDSVEVPLDHVAPPLILIQVKDTPYLARALYEHTKRRLVSILILTEEGSCSPADQRDLPRPAVYVAVPTIDGQREVEFESHAAGSDSAELRAV